MMTKEEVAAIVSYCQESNVSFKQRLEELHIRPATFYDAKRKYAPTAVGENAGESLQLVPDGNFLPNPIQPPRSRSVRKKAEASGSAPVNIELRTTTGTVMRISGSLTGRLIQDIILAPQCVENNLNRLYFFYDIQRSSISKRLTVLGNWWSRIHWLQPL